MAGHFCPPLNPILCTTKQARVRVTRKACNIDSMDSVNAESQTDFTTAKVAKHDFAIIKLNRTKCLHLKRCRGGGFIRGRERLRNLSPSPLYI